MHTLLAVDDELHALKILRLHLEEAGYTVLLSTNGKEALELLANHPEVDCILLDNMMPIMNGMETLKLIVRLNHSVIGQPFLKMFLIIYVGSFHRT